MNILLVASSQLEIKDSLDYLEKNWEKKSFWEYKKGDTTLTSLVTGVGSMLSAFSIARFPNIGEIDYVVNPGRGVAMSRTLDLGRVYLIENEGIADLGLEESDGTFNNLHDLHWYDSDKHPFKRGKIHPKKLHNPTFLPRCSGLTVNKMPGTYDNIEYFEKKYHSDMLSFEGAGIMYAARMLELELIQYKVVVRYVEPWQKAIPNTPESIHQLNMRTIDILEKLSEEKADTLDLELYH